ncbi:hypothetical protein, partial [Pseudomonas mediterranea]|uniref:hypothetical protein n=1 Tax=Pseudomonas mediterranea TaxID=183795 RepID=UPI0019D3FFB1
LAPAGLRSNLIFNGRCAPKREQAPSPLAPCYNDPDFHPKACPQQVDNPISKAVLAIFTFAPPFSTEGFYVFQQSPRRFTFASAVYLAQRQADGNQPAQSQ